MLSVRAALTLITCCLLFAVSRSALVTHITPNKGSLWGGMKLVIHGDRFAANQFNYGDGNKHLGNYVLMVSDTKSYVCDIHKDGCTEQQIMCYTRAMVEESYYVQVFIDGQKIQKSEMCSSDYNRCKFTPSNSCTPRIRSISPRTNTPGDLVTIEGKFFSNRFSSHLESSTNGRTELITRVYFGGQKCELIEDFDLSIPYDFVFDSESSDDGHMTCLTQGTYVGNVNASFLVEAPFGRSYPEGSVLKVFADNSIAMFQTYAVIDSITPSVGSIAGGTMLNISGQYFDDTDLKIDVRVGGDECVVEQFNTDNIICLTPEETQRTGLYRGGRGLTHYIFNTSVTLQSDFNSLILTDGIESRLDTVEFSDNITQSSSISTGLLVVPRSGEYDFTLTGKARLVDLLFSTTNSPQNTTSLISRTHSSDKTYPVISKRLELQAGSEYYIEIRHSASGSDSHLSLSTRMYNTDKVASQTGSAVNEQQRLKMVSTIRSETQSVDISSWNSKTGVNEIQTIDVTSATHGDIADFRLGMDGVFSSWLTSQATADEVESALNSLPTVAPDTVSVSRQDVTGGYRYQVTFNSGRGSWSLIDVFSKEGPALTTSIKRTKTAEPDAKSVVLSMDGIPTKPISKTANSAQVKEVFEDLFSVRCPGFLTSPSGASVNEQFEDINVGYDSKHGGTVRIDRYPFCGRKSIYNPRYLLARDKSLSLNKAPHLCLSYLGVFNNYIKINVSYIQDKEMKTHMRGYNIPSDTFQPFDNEWHFTCIDIESVLKTAHPDGLYMQYNRVEVSLDRSRDNYVDTVYVGNQRLDIQDPVSTRAQPPRGYLMNEIETTSDSLGRFNVSLYPVNCSIPFSMLNSLSGQAVISGIQSASPPVQGTFDLMYNGKTISNIPASVEAETLSSLLETLPGTGSLNIQRTRLCHNYQWDIDWIQTGGDRPDIVLDTSSVTGVSADIVASTIRDGHTEFKPILGDMIFQPNTEPQVTVSVNGIPSACMSDCSFEYSLSLTAHVTSVSPTSGPANIQLTINGTDFSDDPNDVRVIIGEFGCSIVSTTTEQIICQLSNYTQRGAQRVDLHISDSGLANGVHTYELISEVNSITPDDGHQSGGYDIVLEGSGLSDIKLITYDKSPICNLMYNNDTNIICTVLPLQDVVGSIDLYLEFGDGYTLTKSGFAVLNQTSSSTITQLSTDQGSVFEPRSLTITGEGFGSTPRTVYLEPNPVLDITNWSDTEIQVTLPPLVPGQYLLLVQTNDGYSHPANNSVATITYPLEITDIDPRVTAVNGGTKHTITGSGFGSNSSIVSVKIGSVDCDIETITDTQIECQTQQPSTTHYVNNAGSHPTFGKYYVWNPTLLTVQTGDSIEWSWESPVGVDDVGYFVAQTEFIDSRESLLRGFHSGSKTARGSYTYTFTEPGVFNYWSGPVDAAGAVRMRGRVEVVERDQWFGNVVVVVSGITADSNLSSSPTTSRRKRATCTPESFTCSYNNTNQVESCDVGAIVTDITPTEGTINELITITGFGFSTQSCNLDIKFAGIPCAVESSSFTEITCKLDLDFISQIQPAVGVVLPLDLYVDNTGTAQLHVTGESNKGFTLVPLISELSYHTGSLAGGHTLNITGSGFRSMASTNINIGFSDCAPVYMDYNTVTCITQQSLTWSGNLTLTTLSKSGIQYEAVCEGDCSYRFNAATTPIISSVTPEEVTSAGTELTITGKNFGSDISGLTVRLSDNTCALNSVSDTKVVCTLTESLPAGDHLISINVLQYGDQGKNSITVTSPARITSISPNAGSIHGGLQVTISGNGFSKTGVTSVDMGGAECVISSVTSDTISCTTTAHSESSAPVNVTSNGELFSLDIMFNYSISHTPILNTLTPDNNSGAAQITITGSNLDGAVSVNVGSEDCSIDSTVAAEVKCQMPVQSAGIYNTVLEVPSLGLSNSLPFTYTLTADSITPDIGSIGGGQLVTITGQGFDANVKITICDKTCEIESVNSSHIVCRTSSENATSNISCDVVITQSGLTKALNDAFQYDVSLGGKITSITPTKGGTAGGTTLTITGTGLSAGSVKVSIGSSLCEIQSSSSTQITCLTANHTGSGEFDVIVELDELGRAVSTAEKFYYIDRWCSRFTWGGGPVPEKGDLVVIPAGMTILLDCDTPILKVLLIKGGTLIFDDKDIELQAENILITENGHLQVGTESEPFQHKAIITMWGHLRSLEMPIYGAKTLAVREGVLDLHGKPRLAWTVLSETALAGSTQIRLQDACDWEAGDHIAIASTGKRHSQKENEELVIQSVSPDGLNVTLESPLEYDHLGVTADLGGGHTLEMRAEVGLLTHNVLVRGSINHQWDETIPACAAGFDTGEFATQTCFQGRFGEEMGSDEFGAAIMFHSPTPNTNAAVGRLSHIEVTHAGQAFRLGRYPIHFHLNGIMDKSYVRGCSVHRTFNRAINIHNTHNVLIQNNVIYHIMGGAVFLEDSAETGNILEYNLAIFVISSTSLLNDDVTPAAFWVTHPTNIVRHNHAAGGSHFGFWYRMHTHPNGPSADPSKCPKNAPLGEFSNNTVHSQGWFGLWTFDDYFPMDGNGVCSKRTKDIPALFDSLTTWHCEKGAEWVNGGSLQFDNFLLVNNEKAGIEGKKTITKEKFSYSGPMIKNTIISATSGGVSPGCTKRGIVLPFSAGLMVSNVTFIDFDGECAALGVTSIDGVCTDLCGGWTYKFAGITWVSSPNRAAFRWTHEAALEDLDGTLSGVKGSKTVPTNPTLDTSVCTKDSKFSAGIDGSVCDTPQPFHRFAWNNIHPASLKFKNASLSNQHGTDMSPYAFKRLTHKEGWMIMLMGHGTYQLTYENGGQFTNTSYKGTYYDFKPSDYLVVQQQLNSRPDRFTIVDNRQLFNETVNYRDNVHGDYSIDDNNTLSYIISGKTTQAKREANYSIDKSVNFKVYQCYFNKCMPPPDPNTVEPPLKRPANAIFWSNVETWKTAEGGWGGNNSDGTYGLPKDNTNVKIRNEDWVVLDTQPAVLNELWIYGVLEFEWQAVNGQILDYTLSVTHMVLNGGRLFVGWEDHPMTGNVDIILRGDHATREISTPFGGPVIGAKAIGVFGSLDIHGSPRSVVWTRLSQTAAADSQTLVLEEVVDWVAGDRIVIGPTGVSTWESEEKIIFSVSADRKTLTLTSTLAYKHIGGPVVVDGSYSYQSAAEVGLLSRNVKIIGEEHAQFSEQSFGGRILVSDFFDGQQQWTGFARIENAEFYHMGQEGHTEDYDPRTSVAFLNTGQVNSVKPSYLRKNTFHSNQNAAITVVNSFGLDVSDNVIYSTVEAGIRTSTQNLSLTHNLVIHSQCRACYQDRMELTNFEHHGAIELFKSSNVRLHDNSVAGSERIGYAVRGMDCSQDSNDWSNNIVHTTLSGVTVLPEYETPSCMKISGFSVYNTFDYGVYVQTGSIYTLENLILYDNPINVFPMSISPNPLGHQLGHKTVTVRDSLIVGSTSSRQCSLDFSADPDTCSLEASGSARSFKSPSGGNIGIVFTSFMGGDNAAPRKPWKGLMSYPQIDGLTKIEGVRFSDFGVSCGSQRDYLISTGISNDDGQHPVETTSLTLNRVEEDSKLFFHRPNVGKINSADCVDMDCDAMKKCMVKDRDGTLLGAAGSTAIPQSEYEWGGDPRRGLGDYRIPKTLLTDLEGNKLAVDTLMPNKGIIDNKNCTWVPAWTAYHCNNQNYEMLIIESMDSDTETRRLSPVAIVGEKYVDLINGPQDHGWCSGYTCRKRISTFMALVATGKYYDLHFTSTSPQKLRLQMLNTAADRKISTAIYYSISNRIDVYVNGSLVDPLNTDRVDEDLKYKYPDYPCQYCPKITSSHGSNYQNRWEQTLFVMLSGESAVDIIMSDLIMVSFELSLTPDEFFSDDKIVKNLALFFGVPPEKVRVVNVISENTKLEGRRKRRSLSPGSIIVQIEVGDAPTLSINETVTNQLDAAQLATLRDQLMDAAQTGELASQLNSPYSRVYVSTPLPDPSDPSWASIAASALEFSSEVKIPGYLRLASHDELATEGVFLQNITIQLLNSDGDLVNEFGQIDWFVTVQLDSHGTGVNDLNGTFTKQLVAGQATFDDLFIPNPGIGYVLKYFISAPDNLTHISVSSPEIDVKVRELTVVAITPPNVLSGDVFDISIQIYDVNSQTPASNLHWKGHKFYVEATLNPIVGYVSPLFSGGPEIQVDPVTGTANLTAQRFTGENGYVLDINVRSEPDHYKFTTVSDVITVYQVEIPTISVDKTKTVSLSFQGSNYHTDPAYFETALYNSLIQSSDKNVTFTDLQCSQDLSCSFVISGPSSSVDTTLNFVYDLVKKEFSVAIANQIMTADREMYVNGGRFYGADGPPPKEASTHALPIWAIAVIALVSLGVIVTALLLILFKFKQNRKVADSPSFGSQTSVVGDVGYSSPPISTQLPQLESRRIELNRVNAHLATRDSYANPERLPTSDPRHGLESPPTIKQTNLREEALPDISIRQQISITRTAPRQASNKLLNSAWK